MMSSLCSPILALFRVIKGENSSFRSDSSFKILFRVWQSKGLGPSSFHLSAKVSFIHCLDTRLPVPYLPMAPCFIWGCLWCMTIKTASYWASDRTVTKGWSAVQGFIQNGQWPIILNNPPWTCTHQPISALKLGSVRLCPGSGELHPSPQILTLGNWLRQLEQRTLGVLHFRHFINFSNLKLFLLATLSPFSLYFHQKLFSELVNSHLSPCFINKSSLNSLSINSWIFSSLTLTSPTQFPLWNTPNSTPKLSVCFYDLSRDRFSKMSPLVWMSHFNLPNDPFMGCC